MLWDFVLWDFLSWDFVRRDLVLWDFVLWDSVPDSYLQVILGVQGQDSTGSLGMSISDDHWTLIGEGCVPICVVNISATK